MSVCHEPKFLWVLRIELELRDIHDGSGTHAFADNFSLVLSPDSLPIPPGELPSAARLIHDYPLNETFADFLGGPELKNNGGNITAFGYNSKAGRASHLATG